MVHSVFVLLNSQLRQRKSSRSCYHKLLKGAFYATDRL